MTLFLGSDRVGGRLGVAVPRRYTWSVWPAKQRLDLAWPSVPAADGAWHWAKAKIDGDDVVVWAEGVSNPKHVRFGYQSNPVGINLYNRAGLPASPFTTD